MKKKRSIIMSLIILGVIVLSGCGETAVEQGEEMASEAGGVMNGLKDAMQKGVAMKCISSDEDGEWVTYTNGSKFKSEGMMDGKTQMVLITDGASYMWIKDEKSGQKIDKDCIKEFQKDVGMPEMVDMEDNFDISAESLEEDESNGKLNCTPATDADFSVPTDIEFIDQCEVMKEQMQNIKQ